MCCNAFFPNFGLPDLSLEILSCKVLECMLSDIATARIVPPFRTALMAISSVSFVHAAFELLFFYSGPSAKTLSAVAMKIILASFSERREPYWSTHNLSMKLCD